MTNEQINKAIAEACGWKECNEYIGKPPILKMDQYNRSLPNYAGCLNAMHGAEKEMKPYDLRSYREMLFDWLEADCVCASASTRAEAFLRTLGKWEEEA